jgi:hypothetical protein
MMQVYTNARDPRQFQGPDGMREALEQFGPAPGGREMMHREREAADYAVATGLYGVWRSRKTNEDCGRIGPSSRCFCGATFSQHKSSSRSNDAFPCGLTSCPRFEYIPQRPEEVGEWWLPRRKGFNVHAWKANCRCGHDHTAHDPRTRRCRRGGCGCAVFSSAFACVACDQLMEEHDTLFETAEERRGAGRSVGAMFAPLAEMPEMAALVFDRPAKTEAERVAALKPPWRPALPRRGGSDGSDGGGGAVLRITAGPNAGRRAGEGAPSSKADSKPAHGRRAAAAHAEEDGADPERPPRRAQADPGFRQAVVQVYKVHKPSMLGEVDTPWASLSLSAHLH